MHRWSGSRCQLPNRLARGSAELVQLPSAHPTVKGSTYIGAGEPEFDVVPLVDHGVLATYEFGSSRHRGGGKIP